MAVTVYKSSDASAPVLVKTLGSFNALLKAILVDGYGAKAAAGWTRPFNGGGSPVTKAVYRPGAGPMNYIRVVETAGVVTRARVFETMSDVDTGTNGSAAGPGNGADTPHESSSGEGPHPWVCIADARTAYLYIQQGSIAGMYKAFYFGEYKSFATSDPANSIFAADTPGGGANTYEVVRYQPRSTNTNSYALIMRGQTTGLSAGVGIVGGGALAADQSVTTAKMGSNIPYPNPIDNKLWIAPLLIAEPLVPHIRGRLRGLWKPMHILTTLADQDTFTGTGSLAGKTFMLVQGVSGSTPAGTLIVETSDTWP